MGVPSTPLYVGINDVENVMKNDYLFPPFLSLSIFCLMLSIGCFLNFRSTERCVLGQIISASNPRNDTMGHLNINLNPLAEPFIPLTPSIEKNDISSGNNSGEDVENENLNLFQKDPQQDDVLSILKDLRVKNHNRIIIGNLNINSIPNKLDALKTIIPGNIDIFVITETKLDSSFETGQFYIEGFNEPYRLDRNRNGGGILIYIRDQQGFWISTPFLVILKECYVSGYFVGFTTLKVKIINIFLIPWA